MNSSTKKKPNTYLIRRYASLGMHKAMIAEEFDLYESEFDDLLEKDKSLKRAYDLGVIGADKQIHKLIWENQDPGLLLLKARMRLKMEDPVLEALTGGELKVILSKMSTEKRKTLSKLLNVKK